MSAATFLKTYKESFKDVSFEDVSFAHAFKRVLKTAFGIKSEIEICSDYESGKPFHANVYVSPKDVSGTDDVFLGYWDENGNVRNGTDVHKFRKIASSGNFKISNVKDFTKETRLKGPKYGLSYSRQASIAYYETLLELSGK